MMKRGKRTKGQSTAEYAIVIALVLGAAVGMQTYVRRTLQARVADATDALPRNVGANGTLPANARTAFEPLYATSNQNTTSNLSVGVNLVANAGGYAPSAVQGSSTQNTSRAGGSAETGASGL